MIGNLLIASIIPILIWLFQKATGTETKKSRDFLFVIFGSLFFILEVATIGSLLFVAIKTNSPDIGGILGRRIGIYIFASFGLFGSREKIKSFFGKVFISSKKSVSKTSSSSKVTNKGSNHKYRNKSSNPIKKHMLNFLDDADEENNSWGSSIPSTYEASLNKDNLNASSNSNSNSKDMLNNKIKPPNFFLTEDKEKDINKNNDSTEELKERDIKNKLKYYKKLLEEDLISKAEYTSMKKKLLEI